MHNKRKKVGRANFYRGDYLQCQHGLIKVKWETMPINLKPSVLLYSLILFYVHQSYVHWNLPTNEEEAASSYSPTI